MRTYGVNIKSPCPLHGSHGKRMNDDEIRYVISSAWAVCAMRWKEREHAIGANECVCRWLGHPLQPHFDENYHHHCCCQSILSPSENHKLTTICFHFYPNPVKAFTIDHFSIYSNLVLITVTRLNSIERRKNSWFHALSVLSSIVFDDGFHLLYVICTVDKSVNW